MREMVIKRAGGKITEKDGGEIMGQGAGLSPRRFWNRNFFARRLDENRGILLFALILALLCTFISYPGIWYSDSYNRAAFADVIKRNVGLLVTGVGITETSKSWLTVIPSFFMAISKFFTGNILGYTFAQSFAFLSVTFLLIKRLGGNYRGLQYVLFGLSPLVTVVSVYYEAGIGCVTGISVLVLLLSSEHEEKIGFGGGIGILLVIAATFVTFGYRANAFTIIPVLIAYVWLNGHGKKRKMLLTASLVAGLAFVSLFPRILKIDTMSSASAGLVWEVVTAIQRMDAEKQQEYIDYFDEIGGEGSTAKALSGSAEGTVWPMIESGLNTDVLSGSINKDAPVIIVEKYVEFAFREPSAFFDVKWDFTKRTLGIGANIGGYKLDYNTWNMMGTYAFNGFNDSKQRMEFIESYQVINEMLGFYTCQPWLVFLVSICLVVFSWMQRDGKRKMYLFVLLLAFFYYAAYIINTQSFELRYFYPSLYLMMVLDAAIGFSMLGRLLEFARSKFRR